MSEVTIGGAQYYFWSGGSTESAVLILTGGEAAPDKVVCWSYDQDQTALRDQFITNLVASGFDVLVRAHTRPPEYPPDNSTLDFISKVAYWMMQNGYRFRYLFGYSGGGLIILHLAQKERGTYWSAAVATSAPCNWDAYSEAEIYQTAHTADACLLPVCFVAPIEDFTYDQMIDYYNSDTASKQWFDWNNGHDPFGNTATTGESLIEVVVNWFVANIIEPSPPPIPTYSLVILPTNWGELDPPPRTHFYQEGGVVTLTATPFEGREFVAWYINTIEHRENPLDITMDSNSQAWAYFTPIDGNGTTIASIIIGIAIIFLLTG